MTHAFGPNPFDNPKWNEAGRVHDWRNHVGDAIKELWFTFTDVQKQAIWEDACERASSEHWD
jgi:hypothetical protein